MKKILLLSVVLSLAFLISCNGESCSSDKTDEEEYHYEFTGDDWAVGTPHVAEDNNE